MSEEKIILTPAEAESVLPDGDFVHTYANPGAGMFIGADSERAHAIEAIRSAVALEIGGEHCKGTGHGLIVWTGEKRPLFFQADPERLDALEARKAVPA